MDNDLEFLGKQDKKFDPLDELFDKQGSLKRQRKE